MTRNGRAYRLLPWVRLTRDGDCFSLRIGERVIHQFAAMSATPRPRSGKRSSGANRTELMRFIHPTPRASDGAHGGPNSNGSKGDDTLSSFAAKLMHPTPCAADSDRSGKFGRGNHTLTSAMKMMHPTPTAADSKCHSKYARGNHTLTSAMKMMHPTPTAADDNKSPEAHLAMKARMKGGSRKAITSLQVAMKAMHGTPRAASGSGPGGSNSRRSAKARGVYFGRTLSPMYVEFLMGFPINWTELPSPSRQASPTA